MAIKQQEFSIPSEVAQEKELDATVSPAVLDSTTRDMREQTAMPAAPSKQLQAAFLAGAEAVKLEIVALFKGWVSGSHAPLCGTHPEEIAWFLSKRANALIDSWLMNKKLSALTPLSPAGTGVILIPRDRIDHVLDSRTNKDSVSPAGVIELLAQLFAHGTPKYAPNQAYVNQLIMFDANYKALDAAAKGESPCAALQFCGEPIVHLRLETAYWMKPAKTKALEDRALAKKSK
jgi:hypothetical protein